MPAPAQQFCTFQPSEKLARLRLARSENIGPRSFVSLIRLYGSAAEALLHVDELARAGGGKKPVRVQSEESVEKEIAAHEALGATLIFLGEAEYPALLAEIHDAPPVLSVRGDAALLPREAVALVGARNASAGGIRMAYSLSESLMKQNIIVASGLARGIDTAAHRGALAAGDFSTIAVLAGGVDHIYPPENEKLYHQIIEKGAVISEMPLGAKPLAQHFPRRNRIISGLSKATVIVEANLKSGSLITARMALEQGREVGAVPGFPLEGRAEGPNKLLKDGAFLVERAEDILAAIRTYTTRVAQPTLFEEESSAAFPAASELSHLRAEIAELLSAHPVAVDELVAQSGASASAVQVVLLEMELAGALERHAGGSVSRKKE